MSRAAIFFLVFITLGLSILLALLGLQTIQSNLLGWFLLASGLIYFFGVIVVFWIRGIRFWRPKASGEMLKEENNDRSFWFIVLGMIAVFYLPPLEYLYFPTVSPPLCWVQLSGLSILVLGSILFIWSRRKLGEYYSGHVSVIEGQPLVQSGPYRFIRHPAYAGYILIALGLSLGYSSWLGFFVIVSLLIPSVIFRINVEDGLLSEHFGDDFKKYEKRTARLIPGIW